MSTSFKEDDFEEDTDVDILYVISCKTSPEDRNSHDTFFRIGEKSKEVYLEHQALEKQKAKHQNAIARAPDNHIEKQ
ncbi:hypothetical protein HK096_000902 [Nowakowskiella sp. JEL0078]|nr:hypothetical protein HK096_000902 [Nowakowskiella sp. JEL0078]